MYGNIELPGELLEIIGSESREFAVKSARAYPLKGSLSLLLFGAFWLLFTSIFVAAFFGPLFLGKEVEFRVDNVTSVASPDNLGPALVPGLILGVFMLIGLAMLGGGLRMLMKKGGYFVGTQTRLICFNGGGHRSIDWEQFSGDIKVSGSSDKGNITLGMRTGKMVSRKNGPARFVPEEIFIGGIPGVYEVERICSRRIKENDPTPPAAS